MNLKDTFGWDKYLKPFIFKELPRKTGWGAILGTLCALTFAIMVVTGMILAFYYVPDPDKAWDSVQYISNEVAFGSVLRGLHHFGAGAMVLLVFIHLLTVYVHGSYQAPRHFTWITGVILFIIVLGLGFTGYLLPWDVKAYWATVVGAKIPDQFPIVGNFLSRMIIGGELISGFTITRFYAVHTLILPALLAMFVAMHIYLIRVHNLSDPRENIAGEKLEKETEGAPYRFYPEHLNRSFTGFAVLFIILLFLASVAAPQVDEKAGTFIADYLPRPEWYYMWIFQLLTYFTGAWELIGTIIIMVGGLVVLFGVPFFSESKLKGIGNRPVSVAITATFVVCVVYLTCMAYSEASPYNKYILAPSKMSEQAKEGMYTYIEYECSYCHNILGEGGHRTGPDMSNMFRKDRTEKEIKDYIKNPTSQMSSSTMPAYDLTEDQLKGLASFILSLNFRKVDYVVVETANILEEIDLKNRQADEKAKAEQAALAPQVEDKVFAEEVAKMEEALLNETAMNSAAQRHAQRMANEVDMSKAEKAERIARAMARLARQATVEAHIAAQFAADMKALEE